MKSRASRLLVVVSLALAAVAAWADSQQRTIVMPDGVTIHREIDRLIFADAKGMVLYTYDKDRDKPGTSTCTLERHCSRHWLPLEAPRGATKTGDWTIIIRPDETTQWAYQGMPVYTYVDDLTPGVDSGDNARRGLWHTLSRPLPPPTPMMPAGFEVKKSSEGWVFADHDGRIVYTRRANKDGARDCNAACRDRWVAVPAAMLARAVGNWQPTRRDDETLQWAYRGKPLYTLRPGEQPAAHPDVSAFQALRVLSPPAAP